jgi:aryl-alcohol dehydrogenase-like predicted oxidoreductase
MANSTDCAKSFRTQNKQNMTGTPMEYRTLGKTGLSVSALSFGASSLGSVFRDIDEAEGIRTVHLAIDLGINLIDVAPYYGITKAETVLGKALRSLARDRYLLATKVGRYGDAQFDFSAQRVTASVDESLRRLGVDHIDLIQCHDIEFGSLDQVVEETLPALRKLQAQGKVRYIGITGLPLAVFRTVMDRTEVDTILSYCHYELNDTALSDLLPYLERKDAGIISASPLGMGLLTNRGTPAWHPAPTEVKEACARAAAFCRQRGVDIARLAVQFAVANPRIHTTLVGTASPENLRKNVAWTEEPLDLDLLADVLAILRPIHNLTWPSGLPENS